MRPAVSWKCLPFVAFVLIACGSSSSGTGSTPQCTVYACSGDPTASSCSLVAVCGTAKTTYNIRCTAAGGCQCSSHAHDAGDVPGAHIAYDAAYCAQNKDTHACADNIDQIFAKAATACAWVLE